MDQANFTEHGKQTETLEQLPCIADLTDEIHEQLIFISALNIFLSMTAFLANTLILVALHKESSLHPPSKLLYRCLATTDLFVGLIAEPFNVIYLLSLVNKDWNLCRYAVITSFIAGYTLSLVSLLTMAAISVDRLLALLLGLRYKQVVTIKRTYVLVVIFWVVSTVVGTSYLTNHLIAIWYSYTGIPLCILTAMFSYAKIFYTLHRYQNQVQVHVQQQQQQQQQHQQQRQPVQLLNIARYRKAVYSALWVQLALFVCYPPSSIAVAVLPIAKLNPFQFLVLQCTATLAYLNSSLNPVLYCWKIREVRQAVKETIREALCCPPRS